MRRRFLLTAGALFAAAPAAWAQQRLRSVGVFSMLGDRVDVSVSTDAPRDSRLESVERLAMDFKGIGFDLIALRAARDSLRRDRPGTEVSVYRSPVEMTSAEQRAFASGARNAELPAWLVRTIEENKLSHVLLLTRSRGPLNAETSDGVDIGRGTVEGIGFHMDTLYQMRNKTTGAVSTGMLAPYINIRLMLMDTQSAEIVANYEVRESFAFASDEPQLKADPWTFMPNDMKVRTLREMVEKGMGRGMTELLRQR